MRKSFLLFAFLLLHLLFLTNIKAQSSDFNINAYNQFLQSHQNLSSEALLQLYDAGKFVSNIRENYNSAAYFDSINIQYGLTDYERSLLAQNGFVVSGRLKRNSFGEALEDVYSKDLPVFISTDAILHAVHMSYDLILKDTELGILIESVKNLLTRLHSALPALVDKYSGNSAMMQSLKDVDLYITVPLDLLGTQVIPVYPSNTRMISEVISKIMNASGWGDDTLFSSIPVTYDWSQFKPRGHYTDQGFPELANYFRTMIWLGRTEIYLLMPRSLPSDDSIKVFKALQRQSIDAMLFMELFDAANVAGTYNKIESVLKFFVGEQDNVTADNLAFLKNAANINKASDLLDSLKLVAFQDTLKNQSFAYQKILSQILYSDPFKPDSIVPASAFLLFGQRFIVDSYILSNVVYDRTKSCRLLPSSLDPMFALGNSAAAQLLQSEITKYNYGGNLEALRYLIDSYGRDFWKSSFYNTWLNSIRALNPPADRSNLPPFMKTAGFWQEKLNTQLASWTELRHDNLLYAKQSYTGALTCSYPYTYIELFPEFYNDLKTLAENAKEKFTALNLGGNTFMPAVINYFNNLGKVCDTLSSISRKELDGTQFSAAETEFLKHAFSPMAQSCGGSSINFYGWYNSLYFNGEGQSYESNFIVADIHTVPTDCNGTVVGWIKHAGTGPVNLGVFLAPLLGNRPTAFVGPVMSYYEYTSTNFLRLTDRAWHDSTLISALRPSWVNNYLADNKGMSRGPGQVLITSVKNNGVKNNIPNNYLRVKAFPNPFNPVTTISITIPEQLSNSIVKLFIYDIQGRLVKNLLYKNIPAGNYLFKWDGKNEDGVSAASGIYITNLRVAGQVESCKIILLK